MNQIKKNYLYNLLYQILTLILPLVTVPYVSRVLGVAGVGIYSYTYSIVNYFMLISMLGISNYGNRTIAKMRDKKEDLSKSFISIYSIQLFMSLIMIIFYIIYIVFINRRYETIAFIQLIYLLSNMCDINWFFFGLEKFKITVIRSTALKIISLILIFMLVKTKSDLWIYTLILSGSTLFSQLLLFPFLKKEIHSVKIKIDDIKQHIKPILILFIPVIAISLYKIMDKIMLGSISEIKEVGYYEQAEKLITVPLSLITALGTVMMPRISNLVSKNNHDEIKSYIKKSINFVMFLAFPLCLGLIAIASDFIPLFLGSSFRKTATIIYYISFTILFISFANVIRTQYLIPKEKDKVYVISVIIGAIINLVINLLLIPKYKSIGACIGTLFAEFFVMFYQTYAIRKELPIKEYIKDILKFLITSLVMFGIIMFIKLLNISSISTILLQIAIGGLIYTLLNYKYIYNVLDLNKFRRYKNEKDI